MTAPATALRLTLSPEAVRALGRACHWYRSQLYLAVNGKPHDPTIDQLYETYEGDEELGIRDVNRIKEMTLDNTKLEALDRKLTAALEQMVGIA